MSFRTVSAILRGRWLINKQYAETHLPLVLSLLNGTPLSENLSTQIPRTGNQMTEQPFAVDPKTMQRSDLYIMTGYGLKPNPNIAPNSVGVIPISGPIMKYSGDCGEAGSIERMGWMMDMNNRENIGSVLLLSDSPGGQVSGTESFANAVKQSKKPVIGFVDGEAASAMMWILSACTESYAGLASDEVGSIGVYTSFMDLTGWLEKQGVKLHEIYAPQSTDKNKAYRDAMAGNYDLITDDLKDTAAQFINAVATNRPQAAPHQAEWSTGKMYNATQATKLGLIDGIKTLDQAITKAAWLATRNKNI